MAMAYTTMINICMSALLAVVALRQRIVQVLFTFVLSVAISAATIDQSVRIARPTPVVLMISKPRRLPPRIRRRRFQRLP